MSKVFYPLLIWVAFLPKLAESADVAIQHHLLKAAVSVRAPESAGSGVVVMKGDSPVILTCAHVVSKADIEGKSYDINVFLDVVENGYLVRSYKSRAKILKYSGENGGNDLAILELENKEWPAYLRLYRGPKNPDVGEDIWHVGNYRGFLPNSLAKGNIAYLNRWISSAPYKAYMDQLDLTYFNGSSGGLVANRNGDLIGLVARGAMDRVAFMVPARTISKWLNDVGISVE